MEISNVYELKELSITGQIKEKLSLKKSEHFIDDLPEVQSIAVLVNKLDEYETIRSNVKKEIGIQTISKLRSPKLKKLKTIKFKNETACPIVYKVEINCASSNLIATAIVT